MERLGEERGAGGKLRKPPSRKPPSTPYSRPPPPPSQAGAEAGGRRWISKLVDPAYQLISSGATLIFPSLFSKPDSIDALPAPTPQNHQVEQDGGCDDGKCAINLGSSRSTRVASPSAAADRLKSGSKFDGYKQEKNASLSDDDRLSEIEKLLKGKKFSRDELNHLMEILHSRAVDHKPDMISGGDPAGLVVAQETPRISSEEKDSKKALKLRDQVGASPVEIARAYMGNRASEIGLGSKNITSEDERALLHGDESAAKPFIQSPSPKPSACWPGSMAQDQHGYLTPQSQRSKFGLHNFPRTPYSRTIFSKSKTRITPLRGDSNRGMNISSTPFQQSQTHLFGQVKRSDALDNDYGSVGPIRRTRHKPLAKYSSGGSAYLRASLDGPSQVKNSDASEGILSAVKKNMEIGGTSSTSKPQSLYSKPHSSEKAVAAVHPHTTEMARKILEHIDRNPPTPKDKTSELKLVATWKKPESSVVLNAMSNERNTLPNLGYFGSYKNKDQIDQNNYAQRSEDKRNSHFKVPPQDSTSEAAKAVNKGGSASSVTRPVLPSISIGKPVSRWPFTSDAGSGFTFPVSSSGVEPPTPTIVPSLSGSGLQQKEGPAIPSFSFGSQRSNPALVFSFPSTSSATIHEDALDIKFSFGSDEKTRLSFSSFEKDAVCY
nr:nuclear pore complex protein NUP1 isoform X1 [Quercus suber]POF21385.1 nuclear pore complex protein nup1 [Quercus suber]